MIAEFERAEAAVAPIYTAADIVADPQLQAIGTVHRIEDPDLGEMAMQGPLFRMSATPAEIRHTGRAPGADSDTVLGELGYGDDEISQLRETGVVA